MSVVKELLFIGIFFKMMFLVVGQLDLYKGESKSSYSCDVDIAEPFSCTCLHSGLWKIYSSCLEYSYVAVENQHCFSPREMIRRVEQAAKSGTQLSLIGEKRREQYEASQELRVDVGDILVTTRPVTISDGMSKICLGQNHSEAKNVYCLYEFNDLKAIRKVFDGCRSIDKRILPVECYEVVQDQHTCPESFEPRNSLEDLTRHRRMLTPLAVVKNPIADASDPDDEDFWDPTGAEPFGPDIPADAEDAKSVESLIIVSEIWNYLDQQLDEVLGLGNPGTPPASMQDYPVFKILDASKQVMLKTCPSYYVKPEVLDLAVDTFTAVLMKRNYLNEFNNDYAGTNRILTALAQCASNATAFPFIDESSHDECDKSHPKTNPGAYKKFDNESELAVHEIMESYEYDAIIDVVWKIFVNAYQQCYEWFDPTHTDVFRYATIMESLFQGQIHDLWMTGKTQGKMFGGFLGNMKEITEYVTLCAMSTGLETKFPWSVNRPRKMTDSENMRIRRHVQNFLPLEIGSGAVECSAYAQCLD